MKNRLIKAGAAFLAGWMLFAGGMALAEEKRMGDFVYVPAMNVSGSVGTLSLRVEGLALDAQSTEAVRISALPGAEFGVYVFSNDGELTPWANPLYPSEPMRIRSGEGVTNFSLPQGMEFYLRQESAPQGYLFDETALYRIEGEEIVVTNYMPGELEILVQDTLGRPVKDVALSVSNEDGTVFSAVTDENGTALLSFEAEGRYAVSETALPQGVFEALRVLVDGEETAAAQVGVALSSRSRVVFEHPAAGSVELKMSLASVDHNAQQVVTPLQDVRLEIAGDTPISITTDASGFAGVSLLEGLYDISFYYEGDEDVVLPHAQGQMVVESGAATRIELTASQASGRIIADGMSDRALVGGSISFENMATGEICGPYSFDAEGTAVSDALRAGEYRISELIAPNDTQIGDILYEETAHAAESVLIHVNSGMASALYVELMTEETQTYGLYVQQLDDQGQVIQSALTDAATLTLMDGEGHEVEAIHAQEGYARIEALSGRYTLRMDARLAQGHSVCTESEPFDLPSEAEAIVFPADGARLILTSSDENGEPVYGATYSVLDSEGKEVLAVSDAEAQAVTPLLTAGEVRVETIVSPDGYDEAQMLLVAAENGQATRVQMIHPSYGTAELSVNVQRVDERGAKTFSALAGVPVCLFEMDGDGQTLVDTGIEIMTGEDGKARIALKPGSYAALVDADDLPEGYGEGSAVSFEMKNTQHVSAEIVCMDALGGVFVQLSGGVLSAEEMAQVRFELIDEAGNRKDLALVDRGFYAGGLAAGVYTLRQTQIPQGYTLAKDQMIEIVGGDSVFADVPLEEYAILTVNKTGITFSDRMQTYVVPLSGQYGVYTMENGEMKPYPSSDDQSTVWANVTAEQIAQGYAAQLRLPASMEGTTYYLHEISDAPGFAQDEAYHEIMLKAGEEAQVSCTVSSDRGFFTFSQIDALTGEHVSGGSYELIDEASGEIVLSFTLGEESYRNAMAVPVGAYKLRQLSAGEGYAMSEQSECSVVIQPYLTQGGTVTDVNMVCARIPQETGLGVIDDIYAAGQQGLTLLMIDTGRLDAGQTLRVPQMTVYVSGENGERTDVGSIVLSGVTDEAGGRYAARVEYCLEGGGWQPSDARLTGEIGAPVSVSLMDVEDDIKAIRVTYINVDTGEEKAESGFDPGQISVNVEVGAEHEVQMIAEAVFTGEYVYKTRQDLQEQAMMRSARRELSFAAQGSGAFDTVSAGRDGRITGVVFFDQDADGVMDRDETNRYAGMVVSLITPSMEVVSTSRTDGNGRYEFSGISGGEYALQFDAGEKLVFSSGSGYTQHMISGVEDKHYGISGILHFDGDHTDYIVNAGCIYSAHAGGFVMEKMADGSLRGYDGLNVDVVSVSEPDEEPIVVLTDDTGAFRLSSLLPGEYDIIINLPEGYLCSDAQNGVIKERVILDQSEEYDVGKYLIAQAARVSGGVYIDQEGDGVLAEDAPAMEGVSVSLLAHEGGHTKTVAQTVTDEQGRYAFEALHDGEYSVLFELGGEWTFTRYGADSMVYGAVSSSGSTKSFSLMPGASYDEMNAGATLPASLEVFVFADEHADGQKGVYDTGLAEVVITLIRQEDGQDTQEIALTTDKDGIVRFEGVAPGEYVIAYQMPGIYRATKQVSSDTYLTSCVPQTTLSIGRSEPFVLTMGETGLRKTIGAMRSGAISGVVYYDNNADARIGEDEPGCEGVQVELLNARGEVTDTRLSDASGAYAFEGLAPGRYTVRFSAQQECGFSGSERSMARGGVQKSDEPVSSTRSLTVTAAGKITTANAGVVRMASVQGMLFVDSDADCVLGDTETMLEGVSVHLMNGAARNILMSTTTDAQGRYSFDRVTPGTYLIRVDAPQGYVFSGAMAGSPLSFDEERDGRGYSAAFALLGGAHAQNIGFGLLTQGTIGGRIFIDKDYDGFAGEREEGLRGALVTLTDLQGNEIGSKTTIRSGEFTFDGLMPGEYALNVSLGEGYVFTTSAGDSLMDRINESSASVYLGELAMGGSMTDLKIGAISPSSVGGGVWLDDDNDGRRADGDAGVSGVMVTLETLTGADAGKRVTTTTDAQGSYVFDYVMPGEVRLHFEIADGYAFAKKSSGTRGISCVPMTDALSAQSDSFAVVSGEKRLNLDAGILPVGTIDGIVWKDAAYDGRFNGEEGIEGVQVALINADSGETVSHALTDASGMYRIGFVRPGEYALAFTLPEGMIFTQEGDGCVPAADASLAQSERFSMRIGESRSGMNAGAIIPATLRGMISVDWNENGIRDEDEPGLEGAVITAVQGGTIVTSCKSQEDGVYELKALRPGDYRVRIALPEGVLFSRDVRLLLADPDAQEGEMAEIHLDMGQSVDLPDTSAVMAARVSGRAWMDTNTDGRMDADEPAMTDVQAELLDASGAAVARTGVDADGRYAFELLRSGEYALRFTLGEHVLFADQVGEPGGSSVPVVSGNTAVTERFALQQEEEMDSMNVGGILPGEIGDTIFLDKNGNGMMDYREEQLAGVEIHLLRVQDDGTTEQAASVISDEYGYYRFADLRPGSYVVRVVCLDGDRLTKRLGAPFGEIDSDVDPETGISDVISLISGQTLRNIDIGFENWSR